MDKKISGFLQLTFLGSQAKQSFETYPKSEQTKSFPQGRKIQNGHTGNHQDIPPAREVVYLNRLQGRLLPFSNTGTIQEISEISHPGSDILVQGSTIQIDHITHGVRCDSKGDETDGHTRGYKNPPVLRRLVHESQAPANLSPAYTGSSKNVSITGFADEFKKIRAGTQRSLQICMCFRSGQVQHQTGGRTFKRKY